MRFLFLKNNIVPFLNWAGGKRWFVKKHGCLFPKEFNRYIEPFLGSGSVYFYLQPEKALLGDMNSDLISAYVGIQKNHIKITKLLKEYQKKHSDEYYYAIRKTIFTDPVEQAARFIYLNRTCFNGIYRVNLKGEFNVPRGTKNSVILSTDDFGSLASLLKNANVITADFEELIDQAMQGDLVFADPPYTVRHNNNGFIKYNEKLFSWDDQVRLSKALTRARKRGAKILSTNANHESVRELYSSEVFHLETVSRYSSISAKNSGRNQFEELIIQAI